MFRRPFLLATSSCQYPRPSRYSLFPASGLWQRLAIMWQKSAIGWQGLAILWQDLAISLELQSVGANTGGNRLHTRWPLSRVAVLRPKVAWDLSRVWRAAFKPPDSHAGGNLSLLCDSWAGHPRRARRRAPGYWLTGYFLKTTRRSARRSHFGQHRWDGNRRLASAPGRCRRRHKHRRRPRHVRQRQLECWR